MDTLFFICDLQSRFRPFIHEYGHVVATTNKMLKIAKLFGIPVVATTQNVKALGPLDPEIDLASLGSLHLKTIDKSEFGMLIPEVYDILLDGHRDITVVLMGIETHICVLQTALQLLQKFPNSATGGNVKHVNVYVVADAVSSINAFEIPLAFDTLRQIGAKVLSSESISFLLMRDSVLPTFKEFNRIIKESKDSTKAAGKALLDHDTHGKSLL